MFIDWLILTGIELFIICLSLKLFCLIYNVYVTCISFANLLFMFINFALIENYIYISTGNIRGFEGYTHVFKKASTDPLETPTFSISVSDITKGEDICSME